MCQQRLPHTQHPASPACVIRGPLACFARAGANGSERRGKGGRGGSEPSSPSSKEGTWHNAHPTCIPWRQCPPPAPHPPPCGLASAYPTRAASKSNKWVSGRKSGRSRPAEGPVKEVRSTDDFTIVQRGGSGRAAGTTTGTEPQEDADDDHGQPSSPLAPAGILDSSSGGSSSGSSWLPSPQPPQDYDHDVGASHRNQGLLSYWLGSPSTTMSAVAEAEPGSSSTSSSGGMLQLDDKVRCCRAGMQLGQG